MRVIIGTGSVGMMVTHCIAAALLAHPVVVIVSDHAELEHYKQDIPPTEKIILYPAPQVDEITFLDFTEKIKYDEILNISFVSLIHRKCWFHPLWNKPP